MYMILGYKMKEFNILIYTPFFYPSVGGLERVTDTLATAFSELGHDVTVITDTLANSDYLDRKYKIIRRPSKLKTLKLVKMADVFIHNSISLRYIWPLLIYKRKWVVVHHMTLTAPGFKGIVTNFAKKILVKFATGIAVSKSISEHYNDGSIVIPNPIDLDSFNLAEKIEKDRDVVFLGRLLHDKGCHILLEALAILERSNFSLNATIIGDGKEKTKLEALSKSLLIQNKVKFLGYLSGKELINEISRHQIMVVPSIWPEPFGVVALEGLACGCKVIASDIGGLRDAVGVCGELIEPGNAVALANALRNIYMKKRDDNVVFEHLRSHSALSIASKFITIF